MPSDRQWIEYAEEADILNVLSALSVLNSNWIKEGMSREERFDALMFTNIKKEKQSRYETPKPDENHTIHSPARRKINKGELHRQPPKLLCIM